MNLSLEVQSRNDLARNTKIPELNSKLAEFLGILTGDGYMNIYRKSDYVIEIAGDKNNDFNYLNGYVTGLIKELFNISPRRIIRNNQNSMYLRIRSKKVFLFLEKIGFVKGIKGNIGVPGWILENEDYISNFLRGLTDTDGSLSLKKRKKSLYPVISIASKSKILLKTVSLYLIKKEISYSFFEESTISGRYSKPLKIYRIQISGRKNLSKWLELIGVKNDRHIKKLKVLK